MKRIILKIPRIRIGRILLLSLFMLATAIQPINVMAQTEPEPEPNPSDAEVKDILDFYNLNKITLYSKFDKPCGVGTLPDGKIELIGDSIPEKVWNFLRAKGLDDNQTAGVMGNLQAESGFRPDAIEGGSGIGFGIAQWSFGRRKALEDAARQQNIPASDLGFQLEFLYNELNIRPTNLLRYRPYGNEWLMMRGQDSVNNALIAFHHEFEVSHLMDTANPDEAVINARGGFAQDWYNKFAGKPAGKKLGATDCNDINTGKLNKALFEYAWPMYRDLPEYTTAEQRIPTNGWKKVIDTYPVQGKYIGGDAYPGIDCGGFVTQLVIDSGFDPGYNYEGRIKNGAGYTVIQQKWLDANWTNLNTTVFKDGKIDPAQLQAGDVAINNTHTFIFVGEIPGFDSKLASASLDDRAPMADTAQNPADQKFTWYRKKALP